ncbi:MAG: hypothetical protein J3T61_00630 [Candidatus Brocadiales bacterium]|nr:hypothetical protein [Candidatus Bathyanammoxibius sp.]
MIKFKSGDLVRLTVTEEDWVSSELRNTLAQVVSVAHDKIYGGPDDKLLVQIDRFYGKDRHDGMMAVWTSDIELV